MSIAGVAELPAVASPGATGADPIVGAAQRVQQLQALIAQVEGRAPHASFSEALGAAETAASPQQLGIATPATATSDTTPIAAYAATAASGAGMSGTAGSELAMSGASTSAAGISTAAGGEAGMSGAAANAATMSGTAGRAIASTPVGGASYVPMIEQAAARYGVDPALLYGLIEQESGFDPSARSSAGALGLTQLMPGTAASLGVAEPLDPAEAIAGGARYLAQLLSQFGGNTADALAAYNAGPGAVQQHGGVPPYPETEQYVSKVLGYAAAYSQSAAAAAPSQVSEASA
ncbi:MAG TPA: lytic transglycosylase domain-containing protein [Solirubrobacteraceae bacterium]|nr:lytic transglycosylase domain-containing protein [Solirubrobacteraceae bacterium]